MKKKIKDLKYFEKYFEKDKNNLEQVTTKEIGTFEEFSKKEEYPTFDCAKIFIDKYKKNIN